MKALHDLFFYDQDTGHIRWRVKRNGHNGGVKPGDIAGTISSNGYIHIRTGGKHYYAHRLAWFLRYGDWPQHQIDHINLVKTDNRLANLRQATGKQNSRNQPGRKSRSGIKGVHLNKQTRKWMPHITIDGRTRWFGSFDTAYEAHQVRLQMAKTLYGEFANEAAPTKEN